MVQETGFEISFETTVVITKENLDDIMAAALEGGINHWCKKIEVFGELLGGCTSDQISRGGKLWFYDAESPKTWLLTRDKLLEGVKSWLTNGMDIDHGIYNGIFDSSVVDSVEADCIIQYALFGKVVFG